MGKSLVPVQVVPAMRVIGLDFALVLTGLVSGTERSRMLLPGWVGPAGGCHGGGSVPPLSLDARNQIKCEKPPFPCDGRKVIYFAVNRCAMSGTD
eukprot:1354889-Rhodomonas_salina.1